MICITWPNYWADFSTGCNVTRHTQIFYFVYNLYFVLNNLSVHIVIRIGIGDRGGGQLPPPSVVRNINLSGNSWLRVGQSSCSCFVLIFSFHLSLAPCIKTHTKMQEMALKRLYFSKFSWRACPGPPRGSHAFGVSQANSCLPPQNF